MEIVLLRHGKPDVDLAGNFDAAKLKQLVVDYLEAGIKDLAPAELKNQFHSHYVVCSNLERSKQSARNIGFDKISCSEVLFSETNIPHFDHSPIKLPVSIWIVVLRLLWLLGFSKNGESFAQAKFRARQAANKLIEIAEEHNKAILVGHGLMNRLIANNLRRLGWQGSPSPGKKYWSYGKYTK